MDYMLCFLALAILKVTANHSSINVFDKFHQSDYKIKFERVEVVSYNPEFVEKFQMVTYKYNRTCATLNITMKFKIDIGTKLDVIGQAYKFMSNEYRYFPVRMQVNLCFAISRNLVGLGRFYNCGNFHRCAFTKGKVIHICKWTLDESQFPPFIPEGKYMVDLQMVYGSIEIATLKSYAEASRPFI